MFSFRNLNFFFFIFLRRTQKSLIFRHRNLLKNSRFERIIMRFCKNCYRLNKKYRIKKNLNRYIKCLRLNRKCNLTFLIIK